MRDRLWKAGVMMIPATAFGAFGAFIYFGAQSPVGAMAAVVPGTLSLLAVVIAVQCLRGRVR